MELTTRQEILRRFHQLGVFFIELIMSAIVLSSLVKFALSRAHHWPSALPDGLSGDVSNITRVAVHFSFFSNYYRPWPVQRFVVQTEVFTLLFVRVPTVHDVYEGERVEFSGNLTCQPRAYVGHILPTTSVLTTPPYSLIIPNLQLN